MALAQDAQTVQVPPSDVSKDKALSHQAVVHEGAIGLLGGGADGKYSLELDKYADWKKKAAPIGLSSVGGWLGITEKYWLSALIPDQATPITAQFTVQPNGASTSMRPSYPGLSATIAPGASLPSTTRALRRRQDRAAAAQL